jgi:CMP-N-acetylneuraminic acid synthetase
MRACWDKLYLMRRDVLMENDSLYGTRVVGYPADPSRAANLDTPADWSRAETLLASKGSTIAQAQSC